MIFKGLTAWYLCHRTKPVSGDDIVVVHSAAGGVGQILSAWAAAKGATVLGTVGSRAKVAAAKQAGCHQVHVRGEGALDEALRAATGGRLATVVYDAIGRDTFDASLSALAPFGLMVSYGAASGPVPPVDVGLLGRKGCLYLTRPSIFPHIARREDLVEGCQTVFAAIEAGIARPRHIRRMAPGEIADAHRLLQAGATVGPIVVEVP